MHKQRGFTLIEIIVATALFVVVVSLVVDLFSYTLRVNRQVQSIRIAAQGVRTFVETFAREVRNGEIIYNSGADTILGDCQTGNYNNYKQAVSIRNANNEHICFYMKIDSSDYTKGKLYIANLSKSPVVVEEITTPYFWVTPSTFFLKVTPVNNPRLASSSSAKFQPMVTMTAEFNAQSKKNDPVFKVLYQTSISNDVYDIPK